MLGARREPVTFRLRERQSDGVITGDLPPGVVNRAALLSRTDGRVAPVFVVRSDGWFLVAGPFVADREAVDSEP